MDDPDHAHNRAKLIISAEQLVESADWRHGPVTVRIDRLDRTMTTRVDGMMSYTEGSDRATFATMLSLGPDGLGTPPGKLRVSEGDAGSRWYKRCTIRK
ncbi:MAG: hypothetical protein WCO82_04650 [Sphingomonadales bacterium]